jgi:hypothetical protein
MGHWRSQLHPEQHLIVAPTSHDAGKRRRGGLGAKEAQGKHARPANAKRKAPMEMADTFPCRAKPRARGVCHTRHSEPKLHRNGRSQP